MSIPSFPELPIFELEFAEAVISAEQLTGELAAAVMQTAWSTHAGSIERVFKCVANSLAEMKIPDDEIIGAIKLISEMPAKPNVTRICDTDDNFTMVLKERANATLSQAWTDWTNAIQPLYDHLTDLVERFGPTGGIYGAVNALNLHGLTISPEVRSIDLGQLLRGCIDRIFEVEQAFDWRQQVKMFCQLLEQAVDNAYGMSDAEAEAVVDEMEGLDFTSEESSSPAVGDGGLPRQPFDM